MSLNTKSNLQEISDSLRMKALMSIYHAKSGHPGGVLSCADIISYLYFEEMVDPFDLSNESRDRFILSKGHCAPILYAAASEFGIIPFDELKTLRKLNSNLQGHTHRKTTPWVEASTGSLGQGFSFGIGEAIGLKLQKISSKIFVMLGDGEMQEGEIWEGAMFASHHGLENLCAILDYNKMQSDDLNENIMGLEPILDKWRSFGWNVIELDGHDMEQIRKGFKQSKKIHNKPSILIAHTIKGKGVSFMEGSPTWHGSLTLSNDDFIQSLKELGLQESEIGAYLDD
jgi:transketolase